MNDPSPNSTLKKDSKKTLEDSLNFNEGNLIFRNVAFNNITGGNKSNTGGMKSQQRNSLAKEAQQSDGKTSNL